LTNTAVPLRRLRAMFGSEDLPPGARVRVLGDGKPYDRGTTPPKFIAGDFVWCAFPETEQPTRPSRIRHIGYTLLIVEPGAAGRRVSSHEHDALIAYTTSRPWPHAAGGPSVISFSSEQAATLGQRRGFVLRLWRVARLAVIPAWFPRLSAPDAGVLGHAPKSLRLRLEDEAARVFARHTDNAERLGSGSSRR
jgi:hypothetical protein